MEKRVETVADLGEFRIIDEILAPGVSASPEEINDDCARLTTDGRSLLWSVDPCPTPVAAWFGMATPEVWGHYTAIINISDIAASGGTPVAMLVSIEMPEDMPTSDLRQFQNGLLNALSHASCNLKGGNIKSSPRFSATGTIIGSSGRRRVTRKLPTAQADVFLIGTAGCFWAAVLSEYHGVYHPDASITAKFKKSLCYPSPQTAAGIKLGGLPFDIACMDCSDGPANAIHQLAKGNNLDVTLLPIDLWPIDLDAASHIAALGARLENAAMSFGDWQLACLVPAQHSLEFEQLMCAFSTTKIGMGISGDGRVITCDARELDIQATNQNFARGYNSITSIEDLVRRYMTEPVFN